LGKTEAESPEESLVTPAEVPARGLSTVSQAHPAPPSAGLAGALPIVPNTTRQDHKV
jgi:hypothetical protein